MPQLLLLSSSVISGRGYLDHAEETIRKALTRPGGPRRVLFVPFALHDLDGYAGRARERFARMGIELTSLHTESHPVEAVASAPAFFVGGGNTFRLLRRLADLQLLDPIRRQVLAGGAFYLGASAGTNLAGPTIRTTNDMPIVSPPSLDALGLLPFQINPHYVDADADPAANRAHMGETREERIQQFHEEAENAAPVVGLREPAWLRCEGGSLKLGGATARLFERGKPGRELPAGSDLSFLL